MTERSELAPELFTPTRTENNHTELFSDGPDNFAVLLREIKNAKYYIHFQVMLFYSDEAGFKIARALAEKAKEGVDVRVMSDSDISSLVRVIEKYRSSGTSDFSDLKKLLIQAGVKFVASDKEAYRLSNWDEKRAKLKQKGVPEEFLVMQDAIQEGILLNANVFDHRKVMVFDGKTALIAGLNIANKYLYQEQPRDGKHENGEQWHDGGVLIKGPCVTLLNKLFASKWMVRGGDVFDYQTHYREKDNYGTDACTVFSFFPGMKENNIRNYYLQKVKECRGEFIIENPYINDNLFWEILSGLDQKQAKKSGLSIPIRQRETTTFKTPAPFSVKCGNPFKEA